MYGEQYRECAFLCHSLKHKQHKKSECVCSLVHYYVYVTLMSSEAYFLLRAFSHPSCHINVGGGTGRRETGRKGGGRRGGGKRDSQGGGKREKKGKIMQRCTIFCNRKNAKAREPKNTGREPGLKGTGCGRFKPPCRPPPPHINNCTEIKKGEQSICTPCALPLHPSPQSFLRELP